LLLTELQPGDLVVETYRIGKHTEQYLILEVTLIEDYPGSVCCLNLLDLQDEKLETVRWFNKAYEYDLNRKYILRVTVTRKGEVIWDERSTPVCNSDTTVVRASTPPAVV